jgi:hypothetical protein
MLSGFLIVVEQCNENQTDGDMIGGDRVKMSSSPAKPKNDLAFNAHFIIESC